MTHHPSVRPPASRPSAPSIGRPGRFGRLALVVALVGLVAGLLAAAPAEAAAAPTPAKLGFAVGSRPFGDVALGATSAPQTLYVVNLGKQASGSLAATIGGANPADFVILRSTCTTSTLLPASLCAMTVAFRPTALGPRRATFTVASTPAITVTTELTGTGVPGAQLAVSPSSLAFAATAVGGASAPQSLTFTNSGSAPTGTPAFSLSGADAGDFHWTSSSCTAVLAPAASCTVTLAFNPTAAGVRTATATLSATPGGTATASLTGTGVAPAQLTLTPTAADLGSVAVGSSVTATLTLTNTGGVPSGAVSATATSTGAAGVTLDIGSCGPALAPGSSCQLSAAVRPTTAGAIVVTVAASSVPGGTASAALTAVGVATASLTMNPTSIDFGAQDVGGSATKDLTITNTGATATAAVGVALQGSDPGDFAVTQNSCTGALAAGASCTVTVRFAPTVAGNRSATVVASASGLSATTTLAGVGSQPGVAALTALPTTVEFGQAYAGSNSTAKTVRVTNTGTAASSSLSVSLSGTDADAFAVAQPYPCAAPLAPSAYCDLSVQFIPRRSGHLTATLSVSGSPGGTVVTQLSGTAVLPAAISVDPAQWAFSPVVAGSTATKTFTVTNTGDEMSGPVSVTLDAFSGFTLTASTCAGSLLGRQTCQVTVQFAPGVSGGLYTGVLTVSAVGTPHVTVPLSGAGG